MVLSQLKLHKKNHDNFRLSQAKRIEVEIF